MECACEEEGDRVEVLEEKGWDHLLNWAVASCYDGDYVTTKHYGFVWTTTESLLSVLDHSLLLCVKEG